MASTRSEMRSPAANAMEFTRSLQDVAVSKMVQVTPVGLPFLCTVNLQVFPEPTPPAAVGTRTRSCLTVPAGIGNWTLLSAPAEVWNRPRNPGSGSPKTLAPPITDVAADP
jgi:hypothetical protein